MYYHLYPILQILKPSAGSIKELPRLMGTFPTHNNERERKVEGILVFLYPCPHKAKFLLVFSSTHNRSNKFRITKFPTAQACLYLKYMTHQMSHPCLLQIQTPNVLFNCFRQLSYYKKPYFH